MALLSEIEASVRAGTDHDSDQQITQPQIYAWVNEVYFDYRRRLADLVPDLYTKITADFTIVSGTPTIDLAAAPLSITDFAKVRIVERKEGANYYALGMTPLLMSGTTGCLGFRRRGASTLDFYPVVSAPGTYRAHYVTKPVKLTNGSDVVDLPDGLETAVIESVNARIRVRLDDDPSFHRNAAAECWTSIRNSLVKQYLSTPQTIVDVSGVW